MFVSSFINNQSIHRGSTFAKLNPFNGEPLHTVYECTLLDVVQAIRMAHQAYEEWKASNFRDRQSLILKIGDAVKRHIDVYAELEALDQGLPLEFIKKFSLKKIIQESEKIKDLDAGIMTSCFPTGVVVVLASWNLSLAVCLIKIFNALLAGNSVIVKVSSTSPVTAEILKRIIQEASVPVGLIQVIVSNEIETKKLLTTHPGIHAVSFSGTLQNAIDIIRNSSIVAENSFKKLQIGSGSKNSAICLTAPSSENISSILDSFLIGQGQLAWNSARLFILEKFEKEWIDAISDYLNKLKPSEGITDTSVWGPCLKNNSFQIFQDLQTQAKLDQAKLMQTEYNLTNQQKTCYLTPTFTRDMSKCSELQQQQIFSPLFILSAMKYPFDIAKNANLSYYGFAAHMYGDSEKLVKIANDLEVGCVTYNNWSIGQLAGIQGVKQSGFGIQDHQSFGAFFSNVKEMT